MNEDWIVGGYFNEVLDESEKSEGRRKSRVTMDDFRKVIDKLSLVDIKLNRGWFTWSNNRRGCNLVRERLNRFFTSSNWLSEVSFLASDIIRQANSDNDIVVLDTMERRLRDGKRDPWLLFRHEACWTKDGDAKRVIEDAWKDGQGDVLKGIDNI